MILKKVLLGALVAASALTTSLHAGRIAEPTPYSEDYLPMDQHVLTSKALDGSTLEIEDKSQWKIAKADRAKVVEWSAGDMLEIFPNTQCLRETRYLLHNKMTKQFVRCDLFLSPMAGLEHYKRIKAIDYHYGEVLVENDSGLKTLWRVTSSDVPLLQSWKRNHTIIVGSNTEGWLWSDSNDCILIDVEMNRYVQVQQIN